MSNILRKMSRDAERTELKNKYGKTARQKCPHCKQLSLFKKIEYGELVKHNGTECVKCHTQFDVKGCEIK